MVHVSWEDGALSDGEGAGAGGEMRRGDVVRGLVRRLQRVLPKGDDGRPPKVSLIGEWGPSCGLGLGSR